MLADLGNIKGPEQVSTCPRPLKILRYKTAISRRVLSLPARLALEAEIVSPGDSYLDYGCGRGDDVRNLSKQGIQARGWDPHWCPKPLPEPADIVACVYVINVIEVVDERAQVLKAAWALAKRGLLVAARVDKPAYKGTPYGDGVVTNRQTFQHFYTQKSLEGYITQVFGRTPRALGPGVFYLGK
jgi:DNA phosphorothioation-associated putative methyltransferase